MDIDIDMNIDMEMSFNIDKGIVKCRVVHQRSIFRANNCQFRMHLNQFREILNFYEIEISPDSRNFDHILRNTNPKWASISLQSVLQDS